MSRSDQASAEEPANTAEPQLSGKELNTIHKKENELVGQPVRYYDQANGDKPHAGIITDANYDAESGEVKVNLAVFESSGVSVNKTGVMFVKKNEQKRAHEELESFCVAAT